MKIEKTNILTNFIFNPYGGQSMDPPLVADL